MGSRKPTRPGPVAVATSTPRVDNGPVNARPGWPARLALLLALWPAGVLVGRFAAREGVGLARGIERLDASSAGEREWRVLATGAPGLESARDLVAPVMEGAGAFEVGFAVVTPGDRTRPRRALRSAISLLYHFAPAAWAIGLPYDELIRQIEGAGPRQPDPALAALLQEQGVRFLVFVGLPAASVERVRVLTEEQYGMPILVTGRSLGPGGQLLLMAPVAAEAREGGRYAPLLAP